MQILIYAKVIFSGLAVGLLISTCTFGLEFSSLTQVLTYALAGGREMTGLMDIFFLIIPVFVALVNFGSFFQEEIELGGVAIFSRCQCRSMWAIKNIAVLTFRTIIYEMSILLGFILAEAVIARIPLQMESSILALCVYLLLAVISIERLILLSNVAVLWFGTVGAYIVCVIDSIAAISLIFLNETSATVWGYINPVYGDMMARYDSAFIRYIGVYAFEVLPEYKVGKSIFFMFLFNFAECVLLIRSLNTYEIIGRSK